MEGVGDMWLRGGGGCVAGRGRRIGGWEGRERGCDWLGFSWLLKLLIYVDINVAVKIILQL